MSLMGQHAAPLRLAETPDRISVLAGAMRVLLANPGSAEARKGIDVAMRGCTDEEYEAAWDMVQREQAAPAAIPGAPPATVPRPRPRRDSSLGDSLAFLGRVLRAVTGDTVITWAMAATVAVVAVDAAIVSYSHIYALATGSPGSGFETGIQPRLLPLSIDGVIAEASLVLLFAARHKLDAPKLARFMLALGITATVAANVVHGLPSSMLPPVAHVVISALLSAWPAGAFIGSVELAMQLVRATRDVADTGQDSAADTVADSVPDKAADRRRTSARDKRPDRPADTVADISPDSRRTTTGPRAARTAAPADPVAAMVRRRPSWTDERIAVECGVSTKTVKRRRAAVAAAAQGSRVTA